MLTCPKAAMAVSTARPLSDHMTSASICTAMHSAVHLHQVRYEPAKKLGDLHQISTLHCVQIYNLN